VKFKVGDKVIFNKLLVDNHKDWLMTEKEFEEVKSYLGKIATVEEIEKRFNKNKTVNFFLTVSFSSGFKIDRVNRLAFKLYDDDFEFI
tara:strand:+ start:141 stop:404 length:264 start_codon:yes stop_codon:yes gene_type:complete